MTAVMPHKCLFIISSSSESERFVNVIRHALCSCFENGKCKYWNRALYWQIVRVVSLGVANKIPVLGYPQSPTYTDATISDLTINLSSS